MKYTFREPYILLKQYTSKQGFGNGHPDQYEMNGLMPLTKQALDA